jgi:hypothetical protein
MNRNEYERILLRLEEQRRTGIALVESAYQAQVRSVELVWRLQGEEGFAGLGTVLAAAEVASATPVPQAPPPPPPAPPEQKSAPEVDEDVRAVFSRLPREFTRRDVCKALGYEPYRGALYRSLRKLVADGHACIRIQGEGHKPSVYEKTGGDGSGTIT